MVDRLWIVVPEMKNYIITMDVFGYTPHVVLFLDDKIY